MRNRRIQYHRHRKSKHDCYAIMLLSNEQVVCSITMR
jgi:hypothetical protein